MSSWAERVHRRAADLGSVVTSCGHPGPGPYPYRLEKVKFGVPLEEVCKNDIPGPLLVLILKLNKESPHRRDVFRAPGHQGAMKKLIHFLQAGRLVNVDNYSVYTIASVLKKFLRKIPHGIFGRAGENELFAIIELADESEQQERIHRLFTSLPRYTQHLLVLLFGTFRVIASNADNSGTGMTSEALGVSVAPSFFQSCVSDGKTARMEDVLKFKVATKIMKQIIDTFATQDLFGRENYEYYARVTGRILKVKDEWICSFQYPPPPRGKTAQQNYALQLSLEAEKTWLQCECDRWGLIAQEESRSTPALLTSSSSALDNSALSLGVTPEHSFIESCARLSVSLEGPGVFAIAATSSQSSSDPASATNENIAFGTKKTQNRKNSKKSSHHHHPHSHHHHHHQVDENSLIQKSSSGRCCSCSCSKGLKHSSSCSSTRSSKSASGGGSNSNTNHMTMDELRAVNRYAESTKSLSFLPQVHERQAARMRTRSEWFLGARVGGSLELSACDNYLEIGGSSDDLQHHHLHHNHTSSDLTSNEMFLMIKQHQQDQLYHQLGCYPEDMDTDVCPAATSGGADEQTNRFLKIPVGNIRLSNSAESVQYPVRRPSRRGLSGLTRHHPHRASLRRNKEKITATTAAVAATAATTTKTPSGSSDNGRQSRTVSFDAKQLAGCAHAEIMETMDTTEPVLQPQNDSILLYTPTEMAPNVRLNFKPPRV